MGISDIEILRYQKSDVLEIGMIYKSNISEFVMHWNWNSDILKVLSEIPTYWNLGNSSV